MRAASGEKRERPFPLSGMAAVALACALVLFQGGYYPGAACAMGAASGAAYIVARALGKTSRACPYPAVFLLAVAALFLASSIAHGATATMLQEAAMWFAVAGMALWCGYGGEGDKRRVLDALATAGVVLSVAGIAMFAGILPLEGSVNAGRLMFTVQYANTAGALFGVFAVLCLCSASRYRRFASAAPVIALLLTQSVGAIAVFALAVLALAVRQVRAGKVKPLPVVGAVAAMAAACAGAAVAFPGRVQQASQTFVERIVQMCDAAGLLAGNPLLGIGPAQWQFAYPACQSAQYRAADVHCSYLQVALDGGVLALAVLVGLLAYGLWRLAKCGDFASAACVAMLAVHALFDFDFQFAAVIMVVAMLLGNPDRGEAPAAGEDPLAAFLRGRAGRALCWAVAVIALVMSCAGVHLDIRAGELQDAVARADAARAMELLAASPALGGDVAMRERAGDALLAAGDFQALSDFAEGFAASTPTLSLQQTVALVKLGEDDAALDAMSKMLNAYPYDHELYEAARQLIVDGGLGDRFADAFNAEASRANELAATGRAAWLSNQKAAELL